MAKRMPNLAVEEPIDLAHLAQYTGGERQLNCEVFRLFSDQCLQSLRSLGVLLDMADGKGWRDTAHALRGAALGIGAFALAENAGIAEGLDPGIDPAQAAKVLVALGCRSQVVLAYIETYLLSD
jgi:HPt (histidine-containing phosphotransfer) domain-containing protein